MENETPVAAVPREHVVQLGGAPRRLRYTLGTSRRVIETLAQKRVTEACDSGIFYDQVVLLLAGLPEAHEKGAHMSLAQANALVEMVVGWLEAEQQVGRDVDEIVLVAKRAIAESGICGHRFTFDEHGNSRPLGKTQGV